MEQVQAVATEVLELVLEGVVLVVGDQRAQVLVVFDLKEAGPCVVGGPAEEFAHVAELVDFVVALIAVNINRRMMLTGRMG